MLPRRVAGYGAGGARRAGRARARSCGWAPASGGVGGGRVALYFREDAALLGPPPADPAPEGPVAEALRGALRGGASFWDDLLVAAAAPREEVFTALWAMVWAGEVTNDLWLPLRAPRRLPQLQRPSGRRPAAPGRAAGGAVGGRRAVVAGGARSCRGDVDPVERRRATAELPDRAPRRADALCHAVGGGPGRVLGDLPRPRRAGDARHPAARLLRRRVSAGRSSPCRGPSSDCATSGTPSPTTTRARSCSAPPTPPSPTAPRRRGRRGRATGRRRGCSAPRWCSSTGRRRSTWSAAARGC